MAIHLVTRKSIIENNSIIASELCKIQKAVFDEGVLSFCETEVEKKEYLEKFDCLSYPTLNTNTFNKIVQSQENIIDLGSKNISQKIKDIFISLNSKNIFVLSHIKSDFFGNRNNDYLPLVKAYKKLEFLLSTKSYNEGFIIELSSLDEFIVCLYWIIKCDASIAEYIFMYDENRKIQMNLCQYGNIHLTEFDNEDLTEPKLNSLGLKLIDNC